MRDHRFHLPRLSRTAYACLAIAVLQLGVTTCSTWADSDRYDALYNAIMTRRTTDGKTVGQSYTGPLIFFNSNYLFHDKTDEAFLRALEDFSSLPQTEIESYSNLQRALLQRHLWTVFDWATRKRWPLYEPEPAKLTAARTTIQRHVARLMKRLALSEKQIAALPNPLQLSAASARYRQTYNPHDLKEPFLPPDLGEESGPWVCLSESRGVLPAQVHADSEQWRSAFLVLMRVSSDRNETLRYLEQINQVNPKIVADSRGIRLSPHTPQFPAGTQFVLMERAMLINQQGQPVLSPLVRNLQIRAYLGREKNWQRARAEFVLEPKKLLKGKPGLRALGKKERLMTTFFAADPLEAQRPPHVDPHVRIHNCARCHGLRGIFSVHSLSNRFQGGLPSRMEESTPRKVAAATATRNATTPGVCWKHSGATPLRTTNPQTRGINHEPIPDSHIRPCQLCGWSRRTGVVHAVRR